MKKLLLVLIFSVLTGCRASSEIEVVPAVEAQTETAPEASQREKAPEFSTDNLTEEQKQKLNKSLPQKVREILDNAEELEISVNLNRETGELNIFGYDEAANAVAKITDASIKKELLDSFYFDTATGDGAAACWKPRHKLRAKYKRQTVAITICFDCSHYRVFSPYGKFYGIINKREGRSLPIFNSVIEKYGAGVR
jgi:hypothetical protein